MKYTILELATLSGISTRTLRYYEQKELLVPARKPDSGYRVYDEQDVDVLQQILFYKELGFSLAEIKQVILQPDYNKQDALKHHLKELEAKEKNIKLLIQNVRKTIQKEKGNITMTNEEKFAGFKKCLLEENEEQYGKEIRQKYGDDTIKESNRKLMKLSKEEYDNMQELAHTIIQALESAVQKGEAPQGEEGRKIAQMHKDWLSYTWPSYSAKAHRGLADMYMTDERFTQYYDGNVNGCACFLRDAVWFHIQ